MHEQQTSTGADRQRARMRRCGCSFVRVSNLCCLALLLLCWSSLTACHRSHTTIARGGTTRPAVRGADRGLEVWSWAVSDPRRQLPLSAAAADDPGKPAPARIIIRDDKTDIESLLSPYLSRPVPMPDAVRERWRASGLRIVAVPVTDLDLLLGSCRLIGQVQRQWLGEVPAWTDAARGPTLRAARTVALADGAIRLEPGRLRLLVRAWTVPIAGAQGTPAAGLHVELTPRLDPFVADRERMMAAAAGDPEAHSQVFSTLAVSMTITQTDALVIIPDAPDAAWARPAPEADAGTYGPQAAPLPTLGEILMSSAASGNAVRTRAIIALVPHVPDRFELMAR